MMHKKTVGETTFDIFNHIFMLIFAFICFYPMWYIFVGSFSNSTKLVMHRGILLWPIDIRFSTYKHVLDNPKIWTGYANTIFVVVVGTTLNVLLTAIAAYFLSRRQVFWKNAVMILIVITMFFSGGLIPLYLVVVNLQLRNSLWSLILPTLIAPYNVIVMRTYFMGLPYEMEESAYIDGAGHITILSRIVLPLSMPVVAVMILWYGVGHWNAWFHASIFINEGEKYPLQLVLRQILIRGSVFTSEGGMSNAGDGSEVFFSVVIKYTVIIVCTLPILLIYPLLQKYFVKGIMIGAIKG
jgi:putative aldouronate transport system permease protein